MRPFASDLKLARSFLILCAAGSMLMSCRNLPPNDATVVTTTSGGSGNSSSGSGSSTTSISAGLYIAVQTAWEGTSQWTAAGNCQIPLGSPSGTSIGCTVHLPEARLFFSTTRFLVGSSDSTTCKIVTFQPYFYLGSSTSNAYLPPWNPSATTPVDCTASPIPAGCYNGPALALVSDFPKHTGRYFLTAFAAEAEFDVLSGNSLGQVDNKWMSNAKSDKTAGIAGAYVANSMQDYLVNCTDEWYEQQYQIRLTLADEDSASGEDPNGPLDNFSDWDGY